MMRSSLYAIRSMAALVLFPVAAFSGPFTQINHASSVPGLASFTDANLINPWGISFAAGSPLWVSDQGTQKSTLYNGFGQPQALVVTIPPSGSPGPTGQVFNSTASSFNLAVGGKSTFLFATLQGTIEGWNGGSGTTAQISFAAADGAVYTGLALGTNGTGDFLYAADFKNGKIDAVNSTFAKVSLAGSFADPALPSGYAPFNIQNIGGKLYVEYAQKDPITGEEIKGAGLGIVSTFDLDGNFLGRAVDTGGALNAPWGITLAPSTFPIFGGDLLVGNFGDGTIHAYDPVTFAFLGTITDAANNPLVNEGLWGIGFRTGGPGFDPNRLYFVAGINDEADGLFGSIGVPEPGTLGLTSLAGAVLLIGRAAAKRRRLSR